MEIVLSIVTVALVLCSVVFAFVLYQLMKAVYLYLKPEQELLEKPSLLFRLNGRLVSALFAACFLAMVL